MGITHQAAALDQRMTRTPRRRFARLPLISHVLLAIGLIVLGTVINGLPPGKTDVRIVTAEKQKDGVRVKVAIGVRGDMRCTLTESTPDSSYVAAGVSALRSNSQTLLGRLLHPFPDQSNLYCFFRIEEGEQFTLHLPIGEVRRLSDGEELVLISSNRGGQQARSVSFRAQTVDPETRRRLAPLE